MHNLKRSVGFIIALGLAALGAACAAGNSGESSATTQLSAADVEKRLQEDLIKARPGSTIALPAGKFKFDRTLSLSVAKVTLKGQGESKTILSFSGQKAGSAGLLVKADGFTIEDLAIEDAAGDAHLIAEVEVLVDLPVALRQRVLAQVGLDGRAAVRQHEEAGLAEGADRQHSPCRPSCDLLGIERLGRLAAVGADDPVD